MTFILGVALDAMVADSFWDNLWERIVRYGTHRADDALRNPYVY